MLQRLGFDLNDEHNVQMICTGFQQWNSTEAQNNADTAEVLKDMACYDGALQRGKMKRRDRKARLSRFAHEMRKMLDEREKSGGKGVIYTIGCIKSQFLGGKSASTQNTDDGGTGGDLYDMEDVHQGDSATVSVCESTSTR